MTDESFQPQQDYPGEKPAPESPSQRTNQFGENEPAKLTPEQIRKAVAALMDQVGDDPRFKQMAETLQKGFAGENAALQNVYEVMLTTLKASACDQLGKIVTKKAKSKGQLDDNPFKDLYSKGTTGFFYNPSLADRSIGAGYAYTGNFTSDIDGKVPLGLNAAVEAGFNNQSGGYIRAAVEFTW